MTKAYLSKEVSFSASHVLHVESLSDTENFNIYGKCTRLHGHNYRVRVTLFGSVDELTGMVMNAVHLKTWMEMAIMAQLDHRNIESDVEYFSKRPSTAENVAVFIWNEMIKVMPEVDRCKLYEVKLDETDSISVIYRGD